MVRGKFPYPELTLDYVRYAAQSLRASYSSKATLREALRPIRARIQSLVEANETLIQEIDVLAGLKSTQEINFQVRILRDTTQTIKNLNWNKQNGTGLKADLQALAESYGNLTLSNIQRANLDRKRRKVMDDLERFVDVKVGLFAELERTFVNYQSSYANPSARKRLLLSRKTLKKGFVNLKAAAREIDYVLTQFLS